MTIDLVSAEMRTTKVHEKKIHQKERSEMEIDLILLLLFSPFENNRESDFLD
jgi:hypothetical protein